MKLHSVKFLTLTIVMLAAHGAYSKVLAIDDCGECMGPKAKLVEGGPDKKPFKELVAATKKPIEIARKVASDGPVMVTKILREPGAEKSVSSKAAYQGALCDKFEIAQNIVDIEEMFEMVDESPYASSLNEFWSTPACRAPKKNDTPVPILFNTATDIVKSENFPRIVHDYFLDEKNDIQAWLSAINTKTSDGYTFLDFLQYNIQAGNYTTDKSKGAASRIITYLCANGGIYSKYKDTKKCQ